MTLLLQSESSIVLYTRMTMNGKQMRILKVQVLVSLIPAFTRILQTGKKIPENIHILICWIIILCNLVCGCKHLEKVPKERGYEALNHCELCVGLHGVVTCKTDELNDCEDLRYWAQWSLTSQGMEQNVFSRYDYVFLLQHAQFFKK
jgi:hypothetical protein